MKLNETEAFIRAAAAQNWSQRQVGKALGLGETKFALIVRALPDVQWAPTGKKVSQLATYKSPEWAAGAARGRAKALANRTHTVGDRTGTVPELARLAGLHPSTVNRRLATMSLAEALALPSRRKSKPEVAKCK